MNTLEQRGHDAHERHKRILSLRDLATRTFLKLGEELYWFDKNEEWRILNYASFNAYLADPEVDIKRAWAYRLIAVYKHYVVKLKLTSLAARLVEVGPDKLVIIRDHVTPENAEEMLTTASTNSRSTLKEMYSPAYEPQKQNLHYKFAAAQRNLFFVLQEILEQMPKLRKKILAANTVLDDLRKDIENNGISN